ncbi:class I SAM-dependent methyltransferase [Synechococcus sp. MIT S1220]|uniref:class I SAM-dependent methyltransferase n=1 Tax=Synechococcus sp. MIT S1220 TaxID=3082549 RepID=UPI0039AF96B6
MQRQPEPELMNDQIQVQAYAEADFNEGDAHLVDLVMSMLSSEFQQRSDLCIVDLGCGPGNIALRLASQFDQARIVGIDGSAPMIQRARAKAGQGNSRFDFRVLRLQDCLDRGPCSDLQHRADVVISNSLLHHLHEPELLWRVTRHLAAPGCLTLHRDLRRPCSMANAHQLQQRHLPDAPDVLIRDFLASLVAAFTAEEVKQQLQQCGLPSLSVEEEGDRYLVVSGLVD